MNDTLQELQRLIAGTLRRLFQRPGQPDPDSLAEAILLDLARHHGGQCFYMPKAARLESMQKAARIAAARDRGESIRNLAHKYGMCERAIHNNLARARDRKQNGFSFQTGEPSTKLYQAEIFPL